MKYKDGSKAAADRLEYEDVSRLLRYLEEEITNQEKKEAYAKQGTNGASMQGGARF